MTINRTCEIDPQNGMSSVFANNKRADQPAHPRRLISFFVIHYMRVSYLSFLQAKFQFSK